MAQIAVVGTTAIGYGNTRHIHEGRRPRGQIGRLHQFAVLPDADPFVGELQDVVLFVGELARDQSRHPVALGVSLTDQPASVLHPARPHHIGVAKRPQPLRIRLGVGPRVEGGTQLAELE